MDIVAWTVAAQYVDDITPPSVFAAKPLIPQGLTQVLHIFLARSVNSCRIQERAQRYNVARPVED